MKAVGAADINESMIASIFTSKEVQANIDAHIGRILGHHKAAHGVVLWAITVAIVAYKYSAWVWNMY